MVFRSESIRLFICVVSTLISSFAATAAPPGKAFNPDVSANFLGLWQRGTGVSDDRTQSPHNGVSLQEAEVQLFSDVDPYLKANVLLSVSQSTDTNDYGISPEEVYIETLGLPSLTVRAGKFKMALGKHNQLHTHAFPFIDAPLIHQRLLGEEGLNEAGASAEILLPTKWYSEAIIQAFSLSNDTLYASPHASQTGGLVHLKNLWDLNDDLTTELGLSGTAGNNRFNEMSKVLAADLTFKWKPSVGGRYHSVIWASEYLQGKRKGLTDSTRALNAEKLGGLASWVQIQFSERWWGQARYEFIGLPRSQALSIQQKQSALIGFFPSEFSGFRMQYDHLINGIRGGKDDHTLALQFNVTIGAHPAHTY